MGVVLFMFKMSSGTPLGNDKSRVKSHAEDKQVLRFSCKSGKNVILKLTFLFNEQLGSEEELQ